MNQTELYKALRVYAVADTRRSIIQISLTVGIYLTAIALMILLLRYQMSYWLIALLSCLTAPVFVKLFILFHDCCHTSLLKSRKACTWLGHILGILTFTAYYDWQRTHGIHHRSMANLEQRGTGDVWLMTVDEYRQADRWQKLRYRLYRNPLVMLLVSPPFLFLLLNRFPSAGFRRKDLLSVLFTNAMVIIEIIAFSLTIGWREYLLIRLPMLVIASLMGVWLFYVQHQFREVYWAHAEDWDRYRAAMEGCSFYTMPAVLRWFTGNIGYHHIHHLAPLIPNYKLKQCYDELPVLREIPPVPFICGMLNIFLTLWDEKSRRLVSFREAKAI